MKPTARNIVFVSPGVSPALTPRATPSLRDLKSRAGHRRVISDLPPTYSSNDLGLKGVNIYDGNMT